MVATYSTGYSRARVEVKDYLIRVDHSRFSTKREIATAARECNYRAGNWGKTKLTPGTQSFPTKDGRRFTLYFIDPA